MLYSIPIDPMVLIVGFSILSLVLLIVVIICIVKLNKLYRRYDIFMRGKDAETLEDTIMDIMDEMEERGIVGHFEGSKPRQLLITKEQWQAMQSGQQMQILEEDYNPPVEEEIP